METIPKTTTTLLILFFFILLSQISADDKSAMNDFLKAFTTPPFGWDSSTDFCTWKNVNCDFNKRVTSINLANQGLSARLPHSLNTLSQLTTLYLQQNHFSGSLPSLANLSCLQNVFLNNNNFTSIMPGTFSGLTSLQFLSLSLNEDLSPWPFPSEIKDSFSLVSFYGYNAKMEGMIPDFFGDFPGLQNLRLSYNSFSGSLPASFDGSSIQSLWLNDAGLSGSIDVVSDMTQLTQVWLHGNKFTGPIPDLSNCTEIFDLQLRDNQFTGIVPSSIVSLPKLQNVTLQNNKLQGSLPKFPDNVSVNLGNSSNTNSYCRDDFGACDPQVNVLLEVSGALGYPIKLADSWKGNDACNQWSFVNCDSNKKVITVNFAKQGFSGTISPAFANLTSLINLFLNDNNLTGTIPDSLITLSKLRTINVTSNNLSGILPKFRPEVNFLTEGNKNIRKVLPPPASCPGGSNSSESESKLGGGSNGSSVLGGMVTGLVIAALFIFVVVMVVSYKCYMKKRHRKLEKVQNHESGNEMVETNVIGGVPSELQSLITGYHGNFPVFLRQVTNNFSENNILGRGGSAIVYKGELHDGTKIAVKRMVSNEMDTKGIKAFESEIGVLTNVRHRHLVALLGFCVNGNERLLVFEYMPQGHLGQHLFEWQKLGYSPLTWKQRVSIALDVARGVEYLHSLAQSSFIHRDLKPSNILLGDDMRGKVADFGLVKNAPDGKYSMQSRVAGTFGYVAPEYAGKHMPNIRRIIYKEFIFHWLNNGCS